MKHGRLRKLLILLVTKVRKYSTNTGSLPIKSTEETVFETPEIIVFDNHNHALYFWCEAIQR